MKKQIFIVLVFAVSLVSKAQTAKDLFISDNVKVTWLGVDYSHVKLIGDFSQFSGAGEQNAVAVRDKYFPSWNNLILNESDKYNIKAMLRLSSITNDIDMITALNSEASVKDMESQNAPKYTADDIKNFVSAYNIENGEGIGVLFLAESLNKRAEEAYFHFVALNMKTKEILLHERLRGEPGGIGLRNFWARPIYIVITQIEKVHYKKWKKENK